MSLILKVHIVEQNVTKVIQFESSMMIFNACTVVREKITDSNLGQAKDYGLFLPGSNNSGVWLEHGRELKYYVLKNQDLIEYRRKIRPMKVRMLDGMVKTLMVDDSQPVSQLMVVICTKIGIMNHDEYSLICDPEQEEGENKPNYSTLTLKRKREGEKERDAKMEYLKTIVRTDDEINWVDHGKTLREQGIDEHQILLLKRKYFFSDSNIDCQDPIQLNLLYVQCRDAILDGTHPVTQEQASEFAGIQCQIQFGDHIESRHKSGFLDLKEFLPQSYIKARGIEKKIFAIHKTHIGKNEIEAKFTYVETARSLKTYGVTFFLVKEKMKGRNKLFPRLLGITKDSVLRLDEKTKEILKTWPLTTVKRWAASPSVFTLDFGDYSDQYYPFQTTEGEQIAQLIAGYIDIVVKRQNAAGRDYALEGDVGLPQQEDFIAPKKTTTFQQMDMQKGLPVTQESLAKDAVMHIGAKSHQNIVTGSMIGQQDLANGDQFNQSKDAQQTSVQRPKTTQVIMSKPQRALISTINDGQCLITGCLDDLNSKTEPPELGTDAASIKWKEVTLDANKQAVTSHIGAMNAATAEIVTLTSPAHDEVNNTAVGAAIHTITSNLPEMNKGVKSIAGLLEDDDQSENLMGAAKGLCAAFSDLLTCVQPERKEERQNLLRAATRVGDASEALLGILDEHANQETRDQLMSYIQAVANTTSGLILKSKDFASASKDQEVQGLIINAASNCALAISQLVTCAKAVASTLDNPACQNQLIEAAKQVGRTIENLIEACQDSTNDQNLLADLSNSAADQNEALRHLLEYVKTGGALDERTSTHNEAVESIMLSSDRLLSSQGNNNELFNHAKALSMAASDLINSIEQEASQVKNTELQTRLFAAAKILADATSRMVEAAKECQKDPHDKAKQDKLSLCADDIRLAAYVAAGNPAKRRIFIALENSAKTAAASAIQCIAAAHAAAKYNTNAISQEELTSDCRGTAAVIPHLVEGVKASINSPDSRREQLTLINVCHSFLESSTKMADSIKSVLPTINDPAFAMQLNNSSKQFSQALVDLQLTMDKAREVCGSSEMDSSIHSINLLHEELLKVKSSANDNTLRPLPDETPETTAQNLNNASKSVGSTMAQLLKSVSLGNQDYSEVAARDLAKALKEFASAVRGVVATSQDHSLHEKLLDASRELMDRSLELIEEARNAVQSPQNEITLKRLAQATRGATEVLHVANNSLPGQKDVDTAIKNIEDNANDLDAGNFLSSSEPHGELQSKLSKASAELNDASSEVVTSARRSTQQLAASSKKFASAFDNLVDVGKKMAGGSKDAEVRDNIVVSLKNASITTSKLLVSAKLVIADPNDSNAKSQLQAAARLVTQSINNLIDICTSSAPGQKECESAVRAIRSMRPILNRPSEPISDASYYECLENIIECSKGLESPIAFITDNAKKLDQEALGATAKDASELMCGLIESAAQAAYLVGISDKSSVAGKSGLIDQSQFARAYQAIAAACQSLKDPNISQKDVMSSATNIAKHTSALCNGCRVASAKTNNVVAKEHFMQSAKDVANATAQLVKEIKALDQNYNDENRGQCCAATDHLLESVESLCAFANSPEFASVPAKISAQAKLAQDSITSSGKSIIESFCAMIEAAKAMAVNPKDPLTLKALVNHSIEVTNGTKDLVSSIRDKSPGQKECEEAVDILNVNIRDLDQASLCTIDQNLPQQKENNLKGYNEQIKTSCQALISSIDKVRDSAKFEAENLGHAVTQISTYFTPLVNATIGAASNMQNSKNQSSILDQAKLVMESALPLLGAAKDSGGNPRATHAHPEIEESAEAMKQALQELLVTSDTIATEAGVVSGLVDSINTSISQCTGAQKDSSGEERDSFVDYQTSLVASAKEITRWAQEMVSKSTIDSSQLGNLGANIAREFHKLSGDSNGAIRLAPVGETANSLQTCVHEIGQSCIELIKCGGSCQSAPKDTYYQKALAESARHVGEKVTKILATLKESSRGTQACITATSTVSGIICDLDTTIMFASAGTLNAESEEESFCDHRDNILKAATVLVEDAEKLEAGAAASQEELASAAQNAASNIVLLVEATKSGAASLTSENQESQVMLINAVKDVAMALGDLLQATKTASGKSLSDPAVIALKDSTKTMKTSITTLLTTVKAVQDDQMRGTQALEGTIEAITKEIKTFNSTDQPKTQATPEDLVRATKPITLASAKAVGVGMTLKQDDVIAVANMGRKAIFDMLITCKAAARDAETQELRLKVMNCGYNTAVQYRELLLLVLHCIQKQTSDAKDSLSDVSHKIAQSVTDLVAGAELLKGDDWEDPDDPTVIAENELLGAAESIEAAARKLQTLRPRISKTKKVDESMNFEEIILDACKSIAAATGALIKAASNAQKELVETGRVKRSPKVASDDGQWSEGLISAARLVAASTHSLCEAANSLVLGNASEEKLIASTKQVAAATAQLLVACKVKADPNSEASQRLQEAGNKVKRATDNLVKAAQQTVEQNESTSTLVLSTRPVQSLVQDLQHREKIAKLEKQLEKAKFDYLAIRGAKDQLPSKRSNEDPLSQCDSAQESDTVITVSFTANESAKQPQAYSSLRKSSFQSSTPLSQQRPTNNRLSLNPITPSQTTPSPFMQIAPSQSTLKRTSFSSLYQKDSTSSEKQESKDGPQHEIESGPSFKEAFNLFRNQ